MPSRSTSADAWRPWIVLDDALGMLDAKFARSEPHFKPNVRSQRDDAWAHVRHSANMTDEARRFGGNLQRARKAAGLSQEKLATAAQVGSKGYISDLERGNRPIPPGKTLELLAKALDLSISDLVGAPSTERATTIPIVGYVGAASEFFGCDDHAKGAGLDEIDAPPGVPDGAVAVIVRGDSGYPAIRDGMILVYWNCMTDPRSIEGEDCFVRLEDGRTLVKILERGTEAGRWTLVSINASTPPIRDVKVEWAAPIEVRLRRRNWNTP